MDDVKEKPKGGFGTDRKARAALVAIGEALAVMHSLDSRGVEARNKAIEKINELKE